MTDERNEIRHVNWSEIFSFTYIFKSFKMAIHPSKLILGVMAIVLIYLAGQGLDTIWGIAGAKAKVGEAQEYVASPASARQNIQEWQTSRPSEAAQLLYSTRRDSANLDSRITAGYGHFGTAFRTELAKRTTELTTAGSETVSDLATRAKDNLGKVLSTIRTEQRKQVRAIDGAIEAANKSARSQIRQGKDIAEGQTKAEAMEQLEKDYVAARQSLTSLKVSHNQSLRQVAGTGVFDEFVGYQWSALSNAISSVANGHFVSQVVPYGTPAAAVAAGQTPPGFLYYVLRAVDGFKWLLSQHSFFALVFLTVVLAVWGLLGGAIYRIAALHAAREEKISIFQALKFALSKWPSFFTAPLIPLGVIFVLGALITLGSLLANVPWVGAPIVGILFFLALVLGLAVAFVAVGLVGGAGLMYPTIAVEGSDSFDSISRSFAYIYARPWRAVLYTLVALVYGVICYLFVRLFAYISLAAIYLFMRWGVWAGGESIGASDRVAVIWREPTWANLWGNFNWEAMSTSEAVGGFFIWCWVALVAAVVGSFLLTYLASSSTIIYYLLRRKVDATDLDDVYVQELPEAPAPAEPVQEPVAPIIPPPPPAEPTEGKPSDDQPAQ